MGGNVTTFMDKLEVPLARGRGYSDAKVYPMGVNSNRWSSSPKSTAIDKFSSYLYLSTSTPPEVSIDYTYRAFGFSVRCFYDEYKAYAPSIPVQLTFAAIDGNGSTSAST